MICFCSNSTGWDPKARALIPGGQVDRYISPVLAHLPEGSYTVTRQPIRGAVNVLLSNLDCYEPKARSAGNLVHVSHGIGDKGYRRHSLTRDFDWMLVPGPAHARTAVGSGVPPTKMVEAGYPKLDPLFRGQVDGSGAWADDGRVRVLYAPTHGGGSEHHKDGNRQAPGAGATSWWYRDHVMSLLDEATFQVVLAPHPRHAPGGRATYEQYVGAQVVIADGGSTIYEAMALNIPVVLTTWLTAARNLTRKEGQLLEAAIYRDRYGYHVDSAAALADTVVVASEQGVGERETAFMETVLPARFRGSSGAVYAEFLINLDKEMA